MRIVDQLQSILSSPDFWELEDYRSHSLRIPGGILVEMTGESGRCGWKVTWPNHTERKCDRTFRDSQDAKRNLHEYLTQERERLAYAASSPAESEM